MNKFTHRIRRCNGNKAAWMLVALRDDGSEIDNHGGYTTAMSIDHLLKHARGLLPEPGDLIELVYYTPEREAL